jgi:diguanylate cyclase (GGDEF)-like protein
MTISKRLSIIGAIMVAVMIPTAIAIVYASREAQAYLEEMREHRHVLRTTGKLERAVIDAETAQRAYLLSGDPTYMGEFEKSLVTAKGQMRLVRALIHPDARVEAERIEAVLRPAAAEINLLEKIRTQGTRAAIAIVKTQEGRFEAQELRQAVLALDVAQTGSFSRNGEQVLAMLRAGRWFAVGGVTIGLFASLAALLVVGAYLKRSLEIVLNAMRKADASGIPDDIAAQLSGEFRELRDTYQDMCVRMRREIARRDEAESRIAQMLDESGVELADRRRVSETLARISHRLPACLDQQELVTLASRFIPQLFDIKGGALYFQNNSSTVLSRVATWGECKSSHTEFPPTKCWALRRGQLHHVDDTETDVTCAHLTSEAQGSYVCMPLTAQGETVGLLYLEGAPSEIGDSEAHKALADMRVLCENLALALVNLRLRESLRHQSLRDPLTGLHNRRYLEEVLDLEFAKSRRSGTPLSLVMIDIDHFKSINDTLGHDAGDIVLRHLAATIGGHIRKGDVACRYGGEEFVILLPDVDQASAAERAELLRARIKAVKLRSETDDIPQVTASFGVAGYCGEDRQPADVLRDADYALYQAKAAGRDRVWAARPGMEISGNLHVTSLE